MLQLPFNQEPKRNAYPQWAIKAHDVEALDRAVKNGEGDY